MVANLPSYRPPRVSSRFSTTSFSRIESLRRLIQRRTETAFLVRGYDQSFCQAVTDEAMLAIHADIDEFDQNDFRAWAIRIAVQIGFEKIRKQHVIKRRLLKTKLPNSGDSDQSECPETEWAFLGDKVAKKILAAQELLRRHREMVRGLLDGKRPFYLAHELNLNADFQRDFMGEAVRRLNLLRQHLRTEFAVPSGLR